MRAWSSRGGMNTYDVCVRLTSAKGSTSVIGGAVVYREVILKVKYNVENESITALNLVPKHAVAFVRSLPSV